VAGGRRARAAILTGERGVGKTTLCLELARGRPEFVGIVSPAIVDSSGHKVGFSAFCLQTGERWDLGRSDLELDGPHYGKYSFSAAGITRAIHCLEAALALPGRIVVLDEVGPLEMEQHDGFSPILPLVEGIERLLFVTRPIYLPLVGGLLRSHSIREFTLGRSNREALEAGILGFLRPPRA
jgi:nucleoside-triphosphatase THEP1